jgi:hypothetical protein
MKSNRLEKLRPALGDWANAENHQILLLTGKFHA